MFTVKMLPTDTSITYTQAEVDEYFSVGHPEVFYLGDMHDINMLPEKFEGVESPDQNGSEVLQSILVDDKTISVLLIAYEVMDTCANTYDERTYKLTGTFGSYELTDPPDVHVNRVFLVDDVRVVG